VQAVGADHEIEGARVAVAERDLDALTGLGDRGDDVAEDHVDAGRPRHQDLAQRAADDLEVLAHPMAEVVAGHPVDDIALAVDEQGALHLRARGHDGVMRPGPAQDVERRPAHVDLVPAGHERRGALDDGRGEPVAAQPVGGRQTGDAGSGDQDVHPRLAPSLGREAVAVDVSRRSQPTDDPRPSDP
jgi:hypothetical protein